MDENVNASKSRKTEFDYLRITSIFLVVMCHGLIAGYPYYGGKTEKQSFMMLGDIDKIFSSTMAVVGRLGVPFFFTIRLFFN